MGGDDAIQSRRAEIEVTLDHRLERAVLQLVFGLAQQPPALHDVLDIIDAQRRELLVEIFPAAPITQRRWLIALMLPCRLRARRRGGTVAALHRGTREQTRTNSPDFPPVERGKSWSVRVRELGETGEGAALRPEVTGLFVVGAVGIEPTTSPV